MDYYVWTFFAGVAACFIALLVVAAFQEEEEQCECHSDYCQCKYEEEQRRDRNS